MKIQIEWGIIRFDSLSTKFEDIFPKWLQVWITSVPNSIKNLHVLACTFMSDPELMLRLQGREREHIKAFQIIFKLTSGNCVYKKITLGLPLTPTPIRFVFLQFLVWLQICGKCTCFSMSCRTMFFIFTSPPPPPAVPKLAFVSKLAIRPNAAYRNKSCLYVFWGKSMVSGIVSNMF